MVHITDRKYELLVTSMESSGVFIWNIHSRLVGFTGQILEDLNYYTIKRKLIQPFM